MEKEQRLLQKHAFDYEKYKYYQEQFKSKFIKQIDDQLSETNKMTKKIKLDFNSVSKYNCPFNKKEKDRLQFILKQKQYETNKWKVIN